MNYKKYAITALTAALLAIASCSEQNMPGVNDDCDPRLLTGINALMGQSESRAYVPLTDPNYIGRKDFANGDKLVFTTIKRTNSPIKTYTYAGIVWKRTGGGWNRDENDGQPENIYWSDGESGHTFTAYSLPVGDYFPNGTAIPDGGFSGYGDSSLDFDGTSEFAGAVWLREAATTGLKAEAELDESQQRALLNGLEVVASIWDGSKWTTTRLTDNGSQEFNPVIAVNNDGRAIAVWRSVQTDENIFTFSQNRIL